MASDPIARGSGRRLPGWLPIFIALALAALIGLAIGLVVFRPASPTPAPIAVPLDRPTMAPLVERAAPAVVSIAVLQASPLDQNPLLRDPLYRRFFGVPDEALGPRISAGSGVIVDAGRGLVVTNNHVVQNAQAIEVALPDRRRLEAELIGTDPPTDIALLRIRANDLHALPFGDTGELEVGDHVIAIGNPFGLGQSATAGIVSALGRGLSAEGYENYIQTDAPINPGNSGGPLLNLSGEIVGINSAIFGPGGGNVGIGFAVPANIARHVVSQILEHGRVRRGQIGVVLRDFVPGREPPPQGVEIAAVQPGSSAAEAGLRPGDVIVAADGRPTSSATAVRNAVGLTEVGEPVELGVRRGNRNLSVSVPVRAGPRPQGEEPLILVR